MKDIVQERFLDEIVVGGGEEAEELVFWKIGGCDAATYGISITGKTAMCARAVTKLIASRKTT